MAISSVLTVGLGITVVKAASIIVVSSIKHSVHALWLISSSRSGNSIVSVPSPRRDKDTVCFLPVQRDWCADSAGEIVITSDIRSIETTG